MTGVNYYQREHLIPNTETYPILHASYKSLQRARATLKMGNRLHDNNVKSRLCLRIHTPSVVARATTNS